MLRAHGGWFRCRACAQVAPPPAPAIASRPPTGGVSGVLRWWLRQQCCTGKACFSGSYCARGAGRRHQANDNFGCGSGGLRVHRWRLLRRLLAPEPVVEAPVVEAAPARRGECAAAAPAPAPVRRVIMPQTGPRPIYTRPADVRRRPPQRGRPIFDRPRPRVLVVQAAPARRAAWATGLQWLPAHAVRCIRRAPFRRDRPSVVRAARRAPALLPARAARLSARPGFGARPAVLRELLPGLGDGHASRRHVPASAAAASATRR